MANPHRSRQKIPIQNRSHLHDGLRYMPLDIPRERGWYIPNRGCGSLVEEADDMEHKLYKAHDHANRVGTQLARASKDANVEYERTGKVSGMTFEEWLVRSRSIVAEVYKEKEKMMSITIGNVISALGECDNAKVDIEADVRKLKLEFAEAAMHCRRISAEEYEGLDVRVRVEVPARERERVVIPLHRLSRASATRPSACDTLKSLVDDGCNTFVGVSCPVDVVALAGAITTTQNPCLLPRLGLPDRRIGRCLKTLFLADNALGPHGLNSIAQGLQNNGQLEVFHCVANDIGETGKKDGADKELTASLAALDGIARALRTDGCDLRVLNLSKNNIGPAGAACICKGLAASLRLQHLDLSNNVLGVAGANHIALALTKNSALQVLNLNGSQIARAGLRAVLSALQFNSTLSVLFALDNVGPSALSEMQEILRRNSSLREVHLYSETPWINPNHPAERHGDDNEGGRWSLISGGVSAVHESLRTETTNAPESAEASIEGTATQPRPRVGWKRVAHEGFRLAFFEDPSAEVEIERAVATPKEMALQLERQQARLERARERVRGIANETAMERMQKAGVGSGDVVQHWGPLLTLGVNRPTACQIIGYYAGGRDKASVRCEWCRAEEWKAAVGEFGHQAYECPRRFFEETGEVMPGFTEIGDRDEELWNASGTEPLDAVAPMWATLQAKGYFLESGDPPPQSERMVPLPDFAANGVARKTWSERGAYRSIDAVKRRQLLDARGKADPFAGGAAAATQFLQSRGREHEDIVQHSKTAERFMSSKGYIPSVKDRMLKFVQKVRHNHVEEVQAFVAGTYGKVDLNATDMEGSVPIIVAAQNGHKRLLRMLHKAGAKLDQQDHKGNTALHYTCAFKLQSLTSYLLSKGADDTMTNIKGLTCYDGLA